jgi:hypothetical protein
MHPSFIWSIFIAYQHLSRPQVYNESDTLGPHGKVYSRGERDNMKISTSNNYRLCLVSLRKLVRIQ